MDALSIIITAIVLVLLFSVGTLGIMFFGEWAWFGITESRRNHRRAHKLA